MNTKSLIFFLLLAICYSPFLLRAQIKETCLNWDRDFPKIDSKLSLNISGLEIILNPPASAWMRSSRPGELVAPTKGQFKVDGKKEVHIEFLFEAEDPDECQFNCKEQSLGLRSARDPEEVFGSCFKSCRENTRFKYGKDRFKLPLKLKIYRDESETLRIDSLTYRDPNPIAGKLAYTFPHYFAGDLVECSANAWD
ncbi:hypothetical protein CH371_01605 [Leptospira wolffii]|uniref:Uncharacterized protein n=1 Tax=Leptospira wolffii TaxID=409998 RepID=A0A2M9ZEN4_9LEPT|nr:hypothetical protein [Leptospira wolffii]PJZ66822.1 hypothetical protein CH371_01605 [Leptospira wolffii]